MSHRPSALSLRVSSRADEPTNLPLGGWTQWQHDTAVKMRLEGKGATEIGEVIGRTRHAVIGHLWRRGIRGRLKPRDGSRVAWERGGRHARNAP